MERKEKTLTELARFSSCEQISDINNDLEFLITCTRSDNSRKQLGELGAIRPLLNYLSTLIPLHTNNCRLIYKVLKIFRNLCAGEIANQSSFIHDGGLETVASLAKLTLVRNSEGNLCREEGLAVWQMMLQLLGNVCLAGEDHRSAVWRAFFPEIFKGFSLVQNVKIYEPLTMVICTCCEDSPECLKELCGRDGSPVLGGLLRTSQAVGIAGEWLDLLLVKICFIEPYFVQLFSSLQSQEVSLADRAAGVVETFSLEQACLLHAIACLLTYQMEDITRVVNSRECEPVLRDFVTFFIEIIQKAERSIKSRPVDPPTLPTGLPAIDIMGYSLNILRDLCACEGSPSSSGDTHEIQETGTFHLSDSLISSDLIQLMIRLLQELGPPEAVKKATRQARRGSSSPALENVNQSEGMRCGVRREGEENTLAGTCMDPSLFRDGDGEDMAHVEQTGKACPYKGYRRDIVSVLANASFRRKYVQDQIRECDGLFLLLQQCVVDEKNPFLREWGLWAARNLLEGNRENQREVAELELQNAVNMPAIAEMGMKVEIDPNTRKPKLVNLATQ